MTNQVKAVFGISLFILLLTFFSIYSNVPYTISGNGLLLPEKDWKLIKSSDGTIVNFLKNNRTNKIPHYSSTEFGRGDHVAFSINTSNKPGNLITKGDTIAHLSSHQEHLKLLELKRELSEQQHLKDINLAGDKPQRTRAALEELRMAETDLDAEKRMFERSKQLFEMDVIADQEFEEARNTFNIKKQKVNIAKARYEDLLSGSKREEIDLVEATIESLKEQIALTHERLNALTILSPISGTLSTHYQGGTDGEDILARVVNTENMILMMPVEITKLPYLSAGDSVQVKSVHTNKNKTGEVINIDNTIQSLDGRQIVFVTCLLKNENNSFLPNLKVEASIICGNISPFDYMKRSIRTIYTN